MIINLDDNSKLIILDLELDIDNKVIYKKLFQEIKWINPVVKLFGKTYYPLRQVCTMGKPYGYNGNNNKPEKFSETVLKIMEEVNLLTKTQYNTCVANYYPNGEAYISMHDDGELGCESIATVSYGKERKFVVQNKISKEKTDLILKDGSIVIMDGKNFQKDYKHGIPKQLKIKEPRISLTFRKY